MILDNEPYKPSGRSLYEWHSLKGADSAEFLIIHGRKISKRLKWTLLVTILSTIWLFWLALGSFDFPINDNGVSAIAFYGIGFWGFPLSAFSCFCLFMIYGQFERWYTYVRMELHDLGFAAAYCPPWIINWAAQKDCIPVWIITAPLLSLWFIGSLFATFFFHNLGTIHDLSELGLPLFILGILAVVLSLEAISSINQFLLRKSWRKLGKE